MQHWTMKQLNEIDDFLFAICILNERANKLNPNAPLYGKIKRVIDTLCDAARQYRKEEVKMRIKEMLSQYRRDFYADFECEGCGFVERHAYGYDDRNFHDNVIPSMVCPKCGQSRKSLGIKGEHTATKYPDGFQVLRSFTI